MATAKKTPAAKATKSETATPDAVTLLTSDHKEVKALFKQYAELAKTEGASDEDKQELAEQICAMLTVHAQIEEEIFYPAAKEALGEEADLVSEATVEHASAKELIAQIEESTPADELYDAKVKVLGEYIDHHVKEEESEMFPKAKKAKMDLDGLGAQLMTRKQELMVEMGLEEAEEET